MKIVFMGTPEFALAALKKLAAEHEVLAVYTKEPKVSGRGNKLVKTPVHLWAEEQGIEVRTPKTLRNAEEQAKFAALGADMAVVAAYGLILPPPAPRTRNLPQTGRRYSFSPPHLPLPRCGWNRYAGR